jgi:FtsP/CotA-like multicopper oxidase with cupredoxin domain
MFARVIAAAEEEEFFKSRNQKRFLLEPRNDSPMLKNMSSDDNDNFSKSKVSRRTFLIGGAGFLGGAALLYGCRNAGNIAVDGSNSKALTAQGALREITLDARPAEIEIASGKRVTAWTYDGKLPGTEIRAREGERLRITLKNNLPEDTSIHWHGIHQKGTSNMDGVPDLTQPPIPASGAMVYEFVANSPGTYFYHPHSGLQIERGLSAALIVEAKNETLAYDHEYTLVLDDWLDGSPDLAFEQLKQGISPADGLPKNSSQSSSSEEGGMMETGRGGGMMGMGGGMSEGEACCANPEVAYSTYLINGRAPEAAPEFAVKRGERVRFRVVNAGGATVFRLAVQGHKLTVTHSDGFPVQPVEVDAFEISPGERYDFTIAANNPGAWAIAAAPSGEPERAARAVLRYADAQGTSAPPLDFTPDELNGEVLDSDDLMSLEALDFPQVANEPDRELNLVLSGGGQHSYEWLINGKKGFDEPFEIRSGERVRVRLMNRTMMWHPMHLHGHSFRVINGNNTKNAPVKDTVLVKPMMHGRAEFEFLADNPGNWLIHCHHAYHLAAGMERLFKYV